MIAPLLLLFAAAALAAPVAQPTAAKLASFVYTSEYIVTGSIQLVQMMDAMTSICFFTRISGNFAGPSDGCSITEFGGNWELQYSEGFVNSDIACHARCGYVVELPASPAAAADAAIGGGSSLASVNVSMEYIATGQITEQEMIPAELGICVMTEIGGAFNAPGDQCYVNLIGVGTETWHVAYETALGPGPGDGFSCGSFCACIDTLCESGGRRSRDGNNSNKPLALSMSAASLNAFNVSQEWEVENRMDTQDMGEFQTNFCWLTGFSGDFGSAMSCSVTNSNGRWVLLYTDRAGIPWIRSNIVCRARCITRNII